MPSGVRPLRLSRESRAFRRAFDKAARDFNREMRVLVRSFDRAIVAFSRALNKAARR